MKKRKQTAALLVSAVICLNLIPAVSVSADDAVSISTVNDFKSFTESCVYDEYSKNKKFVLQNDLDLAGEEVKCAEVFCGVFEGGGHSVKNFTLSVEGSNKGLFATVTKDAQIKDLYLTGDIKITEEATTESVLRRRASSLLSRVDIETDEIKNTTRAAGGIAGYNSGKIINCSYAGKITGESEVGGIAGVNAMSGVIDSCASSATVNGESEIGGIVGYNEGRVKLSKNTGKVSPDSDEHTVNVGGIAGESEGALVACTNEGEIGGESFGDNVGGISGKQSGEIRECVNNGFVQGRRSVGGISGRFEPYTDIDLSYASAVAAIDKQIDIFNDDINSARSKILDYAAELLDGKATISEVLDRLGIGGGNGASRLNRLTDAATGMMNSITGAADRASESLDSLTNLSDEATTAIRDTSDSLDDTLVSLNDFLDEFDGKGQEISDTLDNLNEAIDNGESDVDEIKDRLFGQLDDVEEDIDDLNKKLNDTHNNLQSMMRSVRSAGGQVAGFFDDLDDLVTDTQKELNKIKTAIDKMKQDISDRINNARNIINPTVSPQEADNGVSGYSVDPDASLDNEYDVAPSVVGFIHDALTATAYAEEEEKTAISDLKSTDITLPRLIGDERADTALVRYCINNGEVKGNEMSGGIAGSMGFESAVRSGESITLPDGTKVNADSVLKAVVDSCISYGKVTSKENYAGGAVGKCDIGNIRNTLTTGDIESEEGDYAGGTAGYANADIKNCIAVNDIKGESYLGGIAGSAKTIDTSYSLARLDGRRDKSGAVAGFVTGEVNGTYFIDEGLSGINGANLEGKADPVAPADIAVEDGSFPAKMPALTEEGFYMASGDLYMPQIKTLAQNDAETIGALLQSKSSEMARFRFNVIFVDKGKELRSMTVDYGTVLSDKDIPNVSADGREVPAWDKDVHAPIVRHTTFTTEYNRATATLSSGEEPPILLVESVFDEGTEVKLKDENAEREFDGYKKGGAYSFTLTKNAYDNIRVHVRDEKKSADKIAVEENGKWTLLDCDIDGSYAVFEVGAPCKFVILYKETSPLLVTVIIIAALLLAAAGFIIFRRIKRHGKEKETL